MYSSSSDSGAARPTANGESRVDDDSIFDMGRVLTAGVGEMLARSLCLQIRQALLAGKVVDLPGLGRFEIRDKRRYGLVNPSSGARADLGGERAVVYRPDRKLLRDLNASRGQA